MFLSYGVCRLLARAAKPFLSDLCLKGLQISTNQRATRKCIWGSIHSRAFREGKFTVLRNSGILFLTVKRLSNFAYNTRGQVKDMRLLKRVIYAEITVDSSSKLHDNLKIELSP